MSSWVQDLTGGAGLSFVGGALEALQSASNPTNPVSFGYLPIAFISIGVIILAFGLYERMFISKLQEDSSKKE